jgi:3-phosphoshikimate 1-carboxyvinyltransferase
MQAATVWPAPHATGPVRARVALPGSKSLTNRALVLAALADGPSRIGSPLRSRDTLLMAAALRALGTTIRDDGPHWHLTPTVAAPGAAVSLDCGNAGTVARFLPAVAALGPAEVRLHGDERMSQRPLAPLLGALRALGAQVDGDAVPFTVRGGGHLRGGAAQLDASSSSQFVSGLLLAAPRFDDGLDLRHVGAPVPSAIQVEMTVRMLAEAGATVRAEPDRWQVAPGRLTGRDWQVEPDLSSASAFLAAGAATGGEVTVADWPAESLQPGRRLPGLLAAMGAVVSHEADGLRVRGPDRLSGIDVDLHDYGEAVPTLTALAVLAHGPSRLRGVGHLRLQETDRLAALSEELGRLGARVEVLPDGLAVHPAPLSAGSGVVLDPRGDHRLAMAYAVVGLAVPGVQVSDIDTTAKTLPGFAGRWAAMLTPTGG